MVKMAKMQNKKQATLLLKQERQLFWLFYVKAVNLMNMQAVTSLT